jgi:hypothetical protein
MESWRKDLAELSFRVESCFLLHRFARGATLRASLKARISNQMPDGKYKPPYTFSTHIGAGCNKQSRTFQDLADKLKMEVVDPMKLCNDQAPPSKALVKGLAKELDIDENFLNRLADEVRKCNDLG